jgi:hypothetical protein
MHRKYEPQTLGHWLTFRHRMYRMGGIVLMVALVVCASACGVLKIWLWKLNKKAEQRDREQNEGRETFRYVL